MMKNILPIHSLKDGYREINLRTPMLPVSRYVKKIEYFVDIEPGQTIIDFGCGDGAVTAILAKAYPDSHFIGVDYSEELIEYAKKNNSHDNIEYIVVNIKFEKLPFANNSIDKIFSWGVIYYIHPKYEYEGYQLEFIRILKLSGRIVHFQIPLRYDCLSNQIDLKTYWIVVWIKSFKQFIKDLFYIKINEYAYKYSKKDLMKLQSSFSSIQISPDDFFKGRISVIYNK